MDKMKKLLQALLEAPQLPTTQLQALNEAMLKDYKLSYGGFLEIHPKEVEIYYVNRKAHLPYVDSNMHCMLDPKTNDEIRTMQSNRFGKLYMHRKGLGGMDVCLSNSSEYALCCNIKAAEVNGMEYWSQLKVRNAVLDLFCKYEGVEPNLTNRVKWMNRLNQENAITLLAPREEKIEGCVYHLRRRSLRRRDKLVQLPLRSFIDIWNKGLQMNNVQKVNLYMNAHPHENVIDVLRKNGFRYIPAEIKARYRIDKKMKLYD